MAKMIVPKDATGNVVSSVRAAGVPTDATNVYDFSKDPNYNQFLNAAQTQFETERTNKLASIQRDQIALQTAQDTANLDAETARKNLAGAFAKRGMMGGRGGAFQRSQAMQNARLASQQISTKNQIAALNEDFIRNYGTGTGDWTATGRGQAYNQQAIDQALALATQRITGAQ